LKPETELPNPPAELNQNLIQTQQSCSAIEGTLLYQEIDRLSNHILDGDFAAMKNNNEVGHFGVERKKPQIFSFAFPNRHSKTSLRSSCPKKHGLLIAWTNLLS